MSAWAVISPDGQLAWHPLTATAEVEAIVSGEYAPGAIDTAFVAGPIRVVASDIALAAPEHYAPNPLARRVIAELSGGRITQPWRGHVALVQYERDEQSGEWLWPGEMSAEWAARITAAAGARQGGRTVTQAVRHVILDQPLRCWAQMVTASRLAEALRAAAGITAPAGRPARRRRQGS